MPLYLIATSSSFVGLRSTSREAAYRVVFDIVLSSGLPKIIPSIHSFSYHRQPRCC